MWVDCIQKKRLKRKETQENSVKTNKIIESSDKVHVVDAQAITGDEGRSSLRKAAGSWQTSFDPQISEWGNPASNGHSEKRANAEN